MTPQQQSLTEKALNLVRRLSTAQILEAYAASDLMSPSDPATSFVRGNLMDVLEERCPAAFDRWMDSTEQSPNVFFC